jgi:hypothetical protein
MSAVRVKCAVSLLLSANAVQVVDYRNLIVAVMIGMESVFIARILIVRVRNNMTPRQIGHFCIRATLVVGLIATVGTVIWAVTR